jgi:hypothetical protein
MSYMKVEFDRILKQYGHKAYLDRRVANTGNERSDYSSFAQGKMYPVRTRYRIEGDLIGTEEMEGQLNTSKRVYYFQSHVKPWDSDRIWEKDNNDPNSNGWTVWEIDGIVPMRGPGGQIEYYTTEATRIKPN